VKKCDLYHCSKCGQVNSICKVKIVRVNRTAEEEHKAIFLLGKIHPKQAIKAKEWLQSEEGKKEFLKRFNSVKAITKNLYQESKIYASKDKEIVTL
jgi:dissimilatory sulfite reductase (desulfoviridin) alpha/beta subunit